VIATIEASRTLSATTQRDLKSAINRVVGKWLGADLSDTPADPAWLRQHTFGWTAAQFGVTDATLQVVFSQVKRALRIAGVTRKRSSRTPLTPAWQNLRVALDEHWSGNHATESETNRNWLAVRLLPFMRWCSARGIPPKEVDDAILEDFMAEIASSALRGDIKTKDRRLRAAWNRALQTVPGWPPAAVSSRQASSASAVVVFPESTFRASFIEEIDTYAVQRGFLHRDPRETTEGGTFLERLRRSHRTLRYRLVTTTGEQVRQRRLKPLSERSLYWHRRVLLMAATGLVQSGVKEIAAIRSIADVASAEGVACLLDQLSARAVRGTDESAYAVNLVKTLCSIIARCELPLPVEEFAAIGEILGELRDALARREGQITAKNRARIAQFDDPDAFALLVSVSEWEFERLERERGRTGVVTSAMARRAEAAIGNLLLCSLPVRRGTLASTNWERNFRKPTRRGGNATLVYHPEQTKTKRPLQVVLDAWKWSLVALYYAHYRPILAGTEDTTFLFPGRTRGGHKTAGKLAEAVSRFVKRRAGVIMNLHLYRHLLGAKLLEETNDIRLVEELLGHVPGSAATQRYVELKTKWAAAHLDGITDGARPRGRHLLAKRRRVLA